MRANDEGRRYRRPRSSIFFPFRESPLISHRGRRGSASHPRPTDEVRLEPKTLHADEVGISPALERRTGDRPRRRSARGKGSYTPAPAENPAGEQGIAPFSSVARGGTSSTPESCYPLNHIRRDERAGRDSEIAGARRYEHRLRRRPQLLGRTGASATTRSDTVHRWAGPAGPPFRRPATARQ